MGHLGREDDVGDVRLFDQDIGDWAVQSVMIIGGLLQRSSSFNQDLSGWCMDDSVNQMGMWSMACVDDPRGPVHHAA